MKTSHHRLVPMWARVDAASIRRSVKKRIFINMIEVAMTNFRAKGRRQELPPWPPTRKRQYPWITRSIIIIIIILSSTHILSQRSRYIIDMIEKHITHDSVSIGDSFFLLSRPKTETHIEYIYIYREREIDTWTVCDSASVSCHFSRRNNRDEPGHKKRYIYLSIYIDKWFSDWRAKVFSITRASMDDKKCIR